MIGQLKISVQDQFYTNYGFIVSLHVWPKPKSECQEVVAQLSLRSDAVHITIPVRVYRDFTDSNLYRLSKLPPYFEKMARDLDVALAEVGFSLPDYYELYHIRRHTKARLDSEDFD